MHELMDLGWMQIGFLILYYMYPIIFPVEFISGNSITAMLLLFLIHILTDDLMQKSK
jgi:hypothetical protein